MTISRPMGLWFSASSLPMEKSNKIAIPLNSCERRPSTRDQTWTDYIPSHDERLPVIPTRHITMLMMLSYPNFSAEMSPPSYNQLSSLVVLPIFDIQCKFEKRKFEYHYISIFQREVHGITFSVKNLLFSKENIIWIVRRRAEEVTSPTQTPRKPRTNRRKVCKLDVLNRCK